MSVCVLINAGFQVYMAVGYVYSQYAAGGQVPPVQIEALSGKQVYGNRITRECIPPMETLAGQGKVCGYTYEGIWQCMDTARDINYLVQRRRRT